MNENARSRFSADPGWRPRVSVAIPVYNRPKSIEPCIESVLACDYPHELFEVIVIDNASTDRTPEVIAGFGDRIKAVYEAQRGVAAARNAGMRAASGEVLAFTDSDCTVDRNWLSRVVAPLQDPWIGAVGGRILALPAGNDLQQFGERIHDHEKAIEQLRPGYLITMNTAFRLDVIRRLGGFDATLLRGEDVDIAYRLIGAGYALAYVADAIVYHDNRSTVGAFLLEGYNHGYYGVELSRRYAGFQREMGSGGDRRRARPATPYTRPLSTGREAVYWAMFRAAKAVGRVMGSLHARGRNRHV